jgi:glyoxylase-like metal-dependent hydrolase (beta-lactamase superfamily II)
LKVERVSGDAYARIANGDSIYDGWGANQGFVTTKEGAVVVDTGFTFGSATSLLREVRKKSRAPARLVVNTHDHSDHVFGNSIFDEISPAIIAHANCRARLLEMGMERMSGYRRFDARLKSALTGLRICPPRITYQEEMDFTLGETTLRLLHPGKGAHTSGDTMVFLPDEKVLFAGDVVWAGYHPNLEDADVGGWLTALEGISKMSVDHIVPGHGPVAGKSCVAPLAKYLRDFDASFKRLVRDGVPKERIAEELVMEGTRDWRLKMIVERNVSVLYERYRERITEA